MIHKTQVAWTTFEVRELRSLVQDKKMSARRIFKAHFLTRHTEAGISRRMSELGLGDPKYVARVKNAKRLSKQRRKKLTQFLVAQGKLMPDSDVAEKFKTRRRVVTYYRLKLGIRLSNSIRFTSRKFIKSCRANFKALQKAHQEFRQWFWERRRDTLYRTLERDASQNGINVFFRCKSCGEHWPRNSRYFYFGRKHCEGEQSLLPQCRACGR
ncbi:MAG: hypothetical protein V1908_04775 [Candidatus Peregrinibacteria bacterium]